MDKEMQKNMLLAIVLSMLIMIVWMHFFAPEPPERTQPTEQIEPHEQAAEQVPEHLDEAAAPAGELEPVAELLPPEDLAKASDIVVETSHMVATFTTLGGRLTSLRLPEYQSKRGGQVELIPYSEVMQWPLALTFNDPEFGTQTESFIYEHNLYEPSSEVLKELAEGLRQCSRKVYLGTDQGEIRRQLDFCLPNASRDEDLRSVLLAIASEEGSTGKDADLLLKQAEIFSTSKFLVFSRQMTSRLRLIKAFVFEPDSYSFDVYTVFQNTADQPLNLGRGQASYSINWVPGMESSESLPKHDELVGVHLVEKNFGQKPIRKLKDSTEFPETLTWIGLKRKYFFVALQPDSGLMVASMKPLAQKEERVRISLNMLPMKLEPGGIAVNHVRLCAGPMLKDVLQSLGQGFDQIINFGFFDFFGKILLAALLWFNKYVQNYGLAIILLTIVVRVGLFPLNQKSYKSMKEMQALQPLVTELREKYKKNPQEMNKKMMQLYRTHKVNPMGGCLPIAFQMPIFIALFQALRYAVELRGAHFLWINDLSEPDRLFTLTVPFNLPINLLPLLVIVAMLIQQKMTPMAAGGQSEVQQKMMQYMPIIFGFLFYSMPSGLTVYFLVSTVLGLVQQYFVQKAA
ncbi:MAG: membrane protein insertase YidC [Candidatus Hydrogenedentota bacterium]|nr:MAG: membrane protein insertase YidC [Candidatus Hydrogenedentota bacterium]